MKRLVCVMPLLLLACATTMDMPATSVEAVVRALDDQERAAVLARDTAALQRLWSEDFTVNAPNSQVVRGRNQVLDFIPQGFIDYSSFERNVEFVRVDGDYVIFMGSETVKPIRNAPFAGQTVQRRYTNIWKNEGGTWRLVARHANVVPPMPPR